MKLNTAVIVVIFDLFFDQFILFLICYSGIMDPDRLWPSFGSAVKEIKYQAYLCLKLLGFKG